MAGELVVGVGQDLEQRDRRAQHRSDGDAGQHQGEHRIVPPHREAHRIDRPHREHSPREGEELDRADGEREEDTEYGTEARPRRDAEDIGRDQGIAKQALVGRARRSEGSADDEARRHARQAHLQHDDLRGRIDGRGQPEQFRPEDARHIGDGHGVLARRQRHQDQHHQREEREYARHREAQGGPGCQGGGCHGRAAPASFSRVSSCAASRST